MIKHTTDKHAEYSRSIGLGLTPDKMAGLGDNQSGPISMLTCGFTQVPVIEYVTWTMTLPLTDEEIDETFGDEIDLLQNSKSVSGVTSVDSSFVMNGLLQVDMLVNGFGVHIFGEPLTFTALGNAVPVSATSPVWSPDAFTEKDLLNSALSPTFHATGQIVPAELEWGFASWMAGWELANAFQFQWIMNQRYLLINELCADVCYFGPYADAVAAGTSQALVQQYFRQVNGQYRSKSSASIIQPISSRRVGSITSTAGGTPNVGDFHVTRDFDQADVTWGGLRNQGSAGCCQPFRKLIRPVLLEKGLPIGMLLKVQDTYHRDQMQRYMSISEGQGGNVALVTFDTVIGGLTETPTAAVTAVEQTLDASPVLAVQQANTNRMLFKGGAMKLAILIKGFEVWGPWKNYIAQNWVTSGLVAAPSITGTGAGPIGVGR